MKNFKIALTTLMAIGLFASYSHAQTYKEGTEGGQYKVTVKKNGKITDYRSVRNSEFERWISRRDIPVMACNLPKDGDGFVALRSGPDASSEMVFKIWRWREGTARKADYNKSTENWLYIHYGEEKGWAHKRYLCYPYAD